MLADTILLAANWPWALHPNDQLLHHTCRFESSYRCRRSHPADSSHLAITNQKEQEALALCDIPSRLNVHDLVQYIEEAT